MFIQDDEKEEMRFQNINMWHKIIDQVSLQIFGICNQRELSTNSQIPILKENQ